MNTKIILLSLGVAALSSCSTAYKSGQTPDDVYYSPAQEKEAYVQTEQQQDRYQSNGSASPNNYDYYSYRDDRFLRLSVANRMRWYDYDNFYYYDNRYNVYDYSLNSPWNSYFY